MMKTPTISSLNNFPMYQAMLATVMVLYVPSTYLSCTWKYIPFDHLQIFPLPLSPLATITLFFFKFFCFCVLFCFLIPHINEIMQYLSLTYLT